MVNGLTLEDFIVPNDPLMIDLRVNEDESLKLMFAAKSGTAP